MARPSGKRSLAVWMNGERVGVWSLLGQGRHEFRYDENWLDASESRPLSLSMPLVPPGYSHSGAVVEAFFDNLLPENEETTDIQRIDGNLLDEANVERILRAVTTSARGSGEREAPFRISLAGAQEKTALLNRNGRWYEPLSTTPTTHILKLPLGRIGLEGVDMSRSLENEWLCSRLGPRVPRCQV